VPTGQRTRPASLFSRMPKPAPKLGRLTLVCLCLLGVGAVFFWVRCAGTNQALAGKVPVDASAAAAHLTIVNDSNCEWRIVITPALGGEVQTWKLPVAKSQEAVLPGGDYVVDQTMLTVAISTVQTRRFPMKLDAGQAYRWRLVTVLSGDDKNVRLPISGGEDHE